MYAFFHSGANQADVEFLEALPWWWWGWVLVYWSSQLNLGQEMEQASWSDKKTLISWTGSGSATWTIDTLLEVENLVYTVQCLFSDEWNPCDYYAHQSILLDSILISIWVIFRPQGTQSHIRCFEAATVLHESMPSPRTLHSNNLQGSCRAFAPWRFVLQHYWTRRFEVLGLATVPFENRYGTLSGSLLVSLRCCHCWRHPEDKQSFHHGKRRSANLQRTEALCLIEPSLHWDIAQLPIHRYKSLDTLWCTKWGR